MTLDLSKARVGDVAVHRNGGKSKIIKLEPSMAYAFQDAWYLCFEGNRKFGASFSKRGKLYGKGVKVRSVFDIVKIIPQKRKKP